MGVLQAGRALADNQTTAELARIAGSGSEPAAKIAEVVALSNLYEAVVWQRWMAQTAQFQPLREQFSDIYNQYILAMEKAEQAAIVSQQKTTAQSQFQACAGQAALAAYWRVEGLVDQLDLKAGVKVVMVGCGQLPVTALHILDKIAAAEVVCLDICPQAIASVQRLKTIFGYPQLQAQLSDGANYDYAGAELVYIANMVRPKLAVLNTIVATAPQKPAIVVREPYALGHLWAESVESSLPAGLTVKGVGSGSRYLSRDVFLAWQSATQVHC